METNITVNDLGSIGDDRPALQMVIRRDTNNVSNTNNVGDANPTITISRDAIFKVNRNGTISINRSDIITDDGDDQANVSRDTNGTSHDYLDTDQKRLLRRVISESLSPEVRAQCRGHKITVLSDEYWIMMDALKEKADRKRLESK